MARAKELTVTASFTRNLGNYNSCRFEAGVTMSLDNDDKIEDVYAKAWDIVGEEVSKQVKAMTEDKDTVKKGL